MELACEVLSPSRVGNFNGNHLQWQRSFLGWLLRVLFFFLKPLEDRLWVTLILKKLFFLGYSWQLRVGSEVKASASNVGEPGSIS